MQNITRAVGQALFLGLLLLFVIPAGYLAVRIGDTWTQGYTEQMLGAMTALCGGGLILVALLVGAGLYVKLSGGRFSRREPEPPPAFSVEQPDIAQDLTEAGYSDGEAAAPATGQRAAALGCDRWRTL